ncbi:MAG: 4Fe-4S dicluster domain-containing protein [Candidatus Omnitrophota bacterium]
MAKIIIDLEKCKGCFLCVEACPKKLIKLDEKLNKKGVNPVKFSGEDECVGCCFCAMICPDCCIEVYK